MSDPSPLPTPIPLPDELREMRRLLDALGYQRVFNAIGDAVVWHQHRSFSISVEKLIQSLTGITRDEAEEYRSTLTATKPSGQVEPDVVERVARLQAIADGMGKFEGAAFNFGGGMILRRADLEHALAALSTQVQTVGGE